MEKYLRIDRSALDSYLDSVKKDDPGMYALYLAVLFKIKYELLSVGGWKYVEKETDVSKN